MTYKTGKSLADSWKAAFFESSAKENSVRTFLNSFIYCTCCIDLKAEHKLAQFWGYSVQRKGLVLMPGS